MARIVWINPLGTTKFDEPIADELRRVARPDTEVEVRSLPVGPHHLEYHAYEAVLVPPLLEAVVEAERDGFDAAIIGCFFDTGLTAAREIAQEMAVAGPCESALRIATSLGDSFSVILGQRKWVPNVEHKVSHYGMRERMRSIKTVDLHVHDFNDQRDTTYERLRVACDDALQQDLAEVCVLGCTIEYGMFERLQPELGAPVVDATAAPLKYAELLADIRSLGWRTSRLGLYETPPLQELEEWGLADSLAVRGPVSST